MTPLETTRWEALQAAIQRHKPECVGDTRFITDEPTEALQAVMADICERCPLFQYCDDYAEHVKAGFWAGKNRLPKGRHK